jgi:hypothetical protein
MGGTTFWVRLTSEVTKDGVPMLRLYIKAINGVRGVSTLMNALRANAIEAGFAQLVFEGDLVAGSRAAVFAEYARRMIVDMGDKGLLIQDNDMTIMYWLIKT